MRRSPTEVRPGWKPGIVRSMLIVSSAATAVIVAIVFFYFFSPSGQVAGAARETHRRT